MRMSITLKDKHDHCELELSNLLDNEEDVILAIHDNDECLNVQVKIEELKLAIRKLTAK